MDRRHLVLLGLSASALAAPLPATAQTVTGSYATSQNFVRKSEALLGTGSKLAQLMAAQQGTPLPPSASPSVQPAALAAEASAQRPAVTAAVLRSPYSATPIRLERAAAVTGRPDVFGSVALSVATTPLDKRWQAIAGRALDPASARFAAALRNRPAAERIDLVNRFVNARIGFVDDSRQFGREDVWQSAAESLGRGRGDCEDYAIAKLQLLRAAGMAERDLYLVILKDLVRRSDHAVLAVASEGRLLVLDNGTDRIVDSADIRDYRPIFSYAAGKRWTHGYRRSAEPPMVIASASDERRLPAPAAAPAGAFDEAPLRFEVTATDFAPGLLARA